MFPPVHQQTLSVSRQTLSAFPAVRFPNRAAKTACPSPFLRTFATVPGDGVLDSDTMQDPPAAPTTLLEDMPEYNSSREDTLPPFVVSRTRGFLPRKVRTSSVQFTRPDLHSVRTLLPNFLSHSVLLILSSIG